MATKLCTDEGTNHHYAVAYYCGGLTDISRLRKGVLAGELPCCLLDASMVCSNFQVMVATNKAVNNSLRKQMITKSVYTEIMYSLSPSTSISESLRIFGAKNDSSHVVAVFVGENDDFTSQEESLKSYLQPSLCGGRIIENTTDYINTIDMNTISEVYQLTEEELSISSLEKSLVTAMATKHLS